jgi:hypothetical protein
MNQLFVLIKLTQKKVTHDSISMLTNCQQTNASFEN